MSSKKLTTSSYKKIFKEICGIYDAGMKEAAESLELIIKEIRRAIGARLVETGFSGQALEEHLEKLSKDLTATQRKGFSVRNLRYMMAVSKAFTRVQISAPAAWSIFVLLAPVEDKKTREEYLKKAVSYKLDFATLQKELHDKKLVGPDSMQALEEETHTKPIEVLRPKVKRGILHTYRIKELLPGHPNATLKLDCGFHVYLDLSDDLTSGVTFKPNACVAAARLKDEWKLKPLELDVKAATFLYTYRAFLHRIADADTITVHVDMGMLLYSKQKLRLRNINAPEIGTKAGQKAKEFVQKRLKSVDFFVIKTYSTDLFDRYLVDVFYLPGETDPQKVAQEGIYLNQELIDNGHAQLWRQVAVEDLATLN